MLTLSGNRKSVIYTLLYLFYLAGQPKQGSH